MCVGIGMSREGQNDLRILTGREATMHDDFEVSIKVDQNCHFRHSQNESYRREAGRFLTSPATTDRTSDEPNPTGGSR